MAGVARGLGSFVPESAAERELVPRQRRSSGRVRDRLRATARRQAWLAEYKGRKCGTLGDLGCFSFQNSKHIPAGEGGAITSNSDDLIDRCNSFHNCGRACGNFKGDKMYFTRGNNYRMQQFQAVI